MKLYIAVLDRVTEHEMPSLVVHTVLSAHLQFARQYMVLEGKDPEAFAPYDLYLNWLEHSFETCIVKVNATELDRISQLTGTFLGHSDKILDGIKTCAIPLPVQPVDEPALLKSAKKWIPSNYREGCTECHIHEQAAKSDAEWKTDVQKGRAIIKNYSDNLGYVI